MKALVTGATGFIGIPLLRALAQGETEIFALTRDPARAAEIGRRAFSPCAANQIRWIKEDLGRATEAGPELRAALSRCDTVFHLAGAISYRRSERDWVRRVNLEGTRVIAQAALDAGVRKFVHTSSIVAVGISWQPDAVLTEDAPYNASDLGMEYFDAKHAAEREVLARIERGLPAVIVNPATVVGDPRISGPAGNVSSALRALARLPFLLPGGGCWVDVEDVVSGLLLAAERGQVGARYILGSENLSNAELIQKLAASSGRKPPRITFPAAPLRWVGYCGFQAATRVSGFYLYFDSSKARTKLGWNPRPVWPAMQAMLTQVGAESSA